MLYQHEEVNNHKKENTHKMVEISYEMAKWVGGGEKPKQSGNLDLKCEGSECQVRATYKAEW